MTLTFHLEVKMFGLFWVRYDKTQTFSYIEDARKYIEYLLKPNVKETKRIVHPEKPRELKHFEKKVYRVANRNKIFNIIETTRNRFVVSNEDASNISFTMKSNL